MYIYSGGRYTTGRYMAFNYVGWSVYTRGYIYKSFPHLTLATVMVQFNHTRDGDCTFLQLYDAVSGLPQLSFEFAANLVKVRRGDYNGTLLATSSLDAPINLWNYIEVKATISNSAGVVLVKINGDTYINIQSGDVVDTQNTSTATANMFLFGKIPGSANGYQAISDVLVMDTTGSYCNDLLGDRRVQYFAPDVEGYYAESTPSTGTRDNTVDEVPPVTTDYNTLDAVNERDTFTHAAMGTNQNVVDAVVCTMYGKTGDVGKAKIKGLCRASSTDGEGLEVGVSNTSSYMQSPIYVDPSTSSPFTKANFANAQFGYKRSV